MKNKCERNKSYYFAIQRLSKLKKRFIKLQVFYFIIQRTDPFKMDKVLSNSKHNNSITYRVLE